MSSTPTSGGTPGREPTSHDELAVSAGSYVLGALSPADRAEFERHLPQCRSCRAAVDSLAGLPGLLSRVPPEPEAYLPELPPALLTGLLREVRRDRHRRRWLVTAVASAAAAVAVVAGIAIGRPASAPTAARQTMQSAAPAAVSATVSMTSVAWGTRIDFECRYNDAARGPVPYALVVRDRSGRIQQVGTWTAIAGKVATMAAATDIPRADIAAVEVHTASGRTVLHLDGPARRPQSSEEDPTYR